MADIQTLDNPSRVENPNPNEEPPAIIPSSPDLSNDDPENPDDDLENEGDEESSIGDDDDDIEDIDDPTKRSVLSVIWQGFCNFFSETSVHGFTHIAQTDAKVWERLFWTVTLCISLTVAGYYKIFNFFKIPTSCHRKISCNIK